MDSFIFAKISRGPFWEVCLTLLGGILVPLGAPLGPLAPQVDTFGAPLGIKFGEIRERWPV